MMEARHLEIVPAPKYSRWTREGRLKRVPYLEDFDFEDWLLDQSYRDREREHMELAVACREFFRRMGVESKFGFRDCDALATGA